MKSQKQQSQQPIQVNKKWQPPKTIAPEHELFIKRVGEKLKALRLEKKLNVTQAAGLYGISRSLCYLLEDGKVYFTISSLLHVLDKHDIAAIDFFRDL